MTQEQQLKDAVLELISVLKLTENGKPIEITEDTDLEKFLKEAYPLIEPGDVLSENTLTVIAEVKRAKPKHKKPLEFTPEEIPDIPEQPLTMVDEINSAERLKDLKEIVVAEDQFKKIRGILSGFKTVDELRVVMLKMLEVPVQEDIPEKLHQKVEDLPINSIAKTETDTGKIVDMPELTTKEAILDLPDQSELVGRGTMKVSLIRTKNPFKSLFDISDAVRASIIASMEKNGYDPAHPIILWKDTVIDGHTRLESAKLLGIEEVPVLQKEFATEQEALEYAIHNQRDRRNMSEAELLRCIQAVDKPLTKQEAGSKGGLSNPESKIAKVEPTHKVTAEVLGIGQSKVTDARVVLASAEAIKEVESGKKTISGAAKEIREKKPKKEKVAKEVLSAEDWLIENYYDADADAWSGYEIYEVMEGYAKYYKNCK